jgi:hypothetical protein
MLFGLRSFVPEMFFSAVLSLIAITFFMIFSQHTLMLTQILYISAVLYSIRVKIEDEKNFMMKIKFGVMSFFLSSFVFVVVYKIGIYFIGKIF